MNSSRALTLTVFSKNCKSIERQVKEAFATKR